MEGISIVIIGQNEGESIQKMLSSLQLLMPGSKRIWVLDRCTDGSEKFLKSKKEYFVKTDSRLKGRQTSYCRNVGLSKCDINNDVLFLDGDRFPTIGTLQELTEWQEDIALLLLEEDNRINMDFKSAYGTVHNGFYSCGLFMKRNAINTILQFQKGKLFCENIQFKWGIEDTHLGDVCYHLGLTCDIYCKVRLNGKFDNIRLAMDVLKSRFELRDRLNVKWK